MSIFVSCDIYTERKFAESVLINN